MFLKDEEISASDELLTARILRAREIRNWHFAGRPEDRLPELDLSRYDNGRDDPGVGQIHRVVNFYFREAKKGDLIAVPPRNFAGKVHIGEFADDPSQIFEQEVERYPGDPIPARNIRWLGAIEKVDLPVRVIEAFRKPTPLLLVGMSDRDSFYSAAYRNYYREGHYSATFDVTSAEFDTTSGSVIPAFFNFVAANTQEVDRQSGRAWSFGEGAFRSVGDYAPHLAIDIQSPGILSIASQYITPLVASALLALALTIGPAAADESFLAALQIGNSAAPADDPCVVPVREQVITQMRLMGYDKWAPACELLREAAEKTGLQSEAVVKKD
ncbi:hypothetical protein [Ensifer aridi]|uniref:hypothetical protein n=1 Tax=Ensifer aridi TaxID=1708715 RepID=UPI00358F96FA